MRKYFIDNIRWFCILILVPFHFCMAFNTWGEANYIFFEESKTAAFFIQFFDAWFMSILFLLAGISCRYSLEKRGIKAFLLERMKKLLVPLVFGIIFLCPILAYIANIYHNGFKGSFIEQYKIFFTHLSDFSGYDGYFTPAHFWFVLYLFVVSIVSVFIIQIQKKFFPFFRVKNMNAVCVVLLFVLYFLFNPVLNIGGKSVGKSLILFLLGYYVFFENDVISVVKKYCVHFFIMAFILWGVISLVFDSYNLLADSIIFLRNWLFLLGVFGLFAKYFRGQNKITKYLSENSFAIYEFHFPVLVAFQFFLSRMIFNKALFFVATIILTYAVTFIIVEIVRHIAFLCFMFGMKKR